MAVVEGAHETDNQAAATTKYYGENGQTTTTTTDSCISHDDVQGDRHVRWHNHSDDISSSSGSSAKKKKTRLDASHGLDRLSCVHRHAHGAPTNIYICGVE